MRILEYSPNFGTLSSGIEDFGDNEVTDVIKLSKPAEYGYNSIHKQWVPSSSSPIQDYEPEKPVDLAIFTPEFGENIGRKGQYNFFFDDFENCLNWLSAHMPKFAIFQTEPEAIKHINIAEDYVRDGYHNPSRDKIIYELSLMGYKAYFLTIDEADYGIPLHRKFCFYVATPVDFELNLPKPLFTATGKGMYNKYRTVSDAIGDLQKMGEWVEYRSEPQNAFQKVMRRKNGQKVTWNFLSQKIKKPTKEKISFIRQGSNNETPMPKYRSKGYNRAKWDEVCRCMDDRFYLVSSRLGDSIHPIEDRPFTMREGARLHGLPDNLSFDLKTPKKTVAKMIHNSPSPVIGQLFAIAFGQTI